MTGSAIAAMPRAWCRCRFTPRSTGGKRQVFCRPCCRRAFDAAGRRWVADAIAAGMLTVDALRNGGFHEPGEVPSGLDNGLILGWLSRAGSAPAACI